MQEIMQQVALLASEADETDEQRAQRLEEIAVETDIEAETLYNVEEDLRSELRRYLETHPQQRQDLQQLAQQFGPLLGIDPNAADDLVVSLGTQKALADPVMTAQVVRTLHTVFTDRGLYDQLDEVA
ncbi:hypothetical protein GOC74_02130 [Halomicrobium mukohataei]|uniref:Uncharacterized protein n=1 Tax=Halomicrobium mukohataei TaxID=57705 RepID=A0A847U841_9EURY|nr:hypothetical protein [Halomicrobium mukohataei]NLV08736.1 hypothetical protein [Halomicrobium mukohataei]